MIQPDTVSAGIRIVRAEEAWEPVLFGGMIPILGAGAILWLIRYAIKEPPDHNKDIGPESDELPPPGPKDSDHEGPLT
jgi:hypothetical protein